MKQLKVVLPILALPLLLTGCGGPQVETGVVVEKMMESISATKQVAADGQLKLTGVSDTAIFNGLKELLADFSLKADIANFDRLKFILNLNLASQGPEGDTRIKAEVRGLPDYTYFRVPESQAPAGSGLMLSPSDRWYKVKNPESSSGNVLGGGSRLTEADVAKIRTLIKSARLFTVQTVLADETVKGIRSYHLAALIDATALSNLLDAVEAATNERIKFDRTKAMRLSTDYTYDLWISKRGYRLVRLVAHGNLASAGRSESVLDVTFSRFDDPVGVAAPSEVKEFNLNDLLKSPLGQL